MLASMHMEGKAEYWYKNNMKGRETMGWNAAFPQMVIDGFTEEEAFVMQTNKHWTGDSLKESDRNHMVVLNSFEFDNIMHQPDNEGRVFTVYLIQQW